MPPPTCQACGSRPATHFLCQICDGQQTTRELCSECFAAHQTVAGVPIVTLDGQSCYYCGAPAQSAAPNMEWEQRARGQPVHYACSRCGLVYSEVILAALPTMPDGLTPDAQVEALVALTSEIDRLVRERVREQKT